MFTHRSLTHPTNRQFNKFSLGNLLGLLVVVVALGSSSSARAENEGQEDLDKATSARVTATTFQDLSELVKLIDSALKKGLDEDNTKYANNMLAATLTQRGKVMSSLILGQRAPDPRWQRVRDLAVADLRRAAKLKEKDAEVHFLLARLLILPGGDRDEAMKSLGVVIENEEGEARARAGAYILRAAMQKDKTKRAEDFDKAVELMPDDVNILRTRAMFHLDAQRADEALADLDRALEKNPDDAGLNEARGMALQMKKDYDKALESFAKASELAPNAPSPHLHRAQIYADQEKTPEALEAIDKAVELAPESTSALLLRAWIRQQAKDEKGSLDDVERAIDIAPNSMGVLRMKASLLASFERTDEAIDFIQDLMREKPDDAELMLQLGELYQADKQPRRAIRLFAAVLTSDENNLQALRARADALLSIGKQKEAVADYETSLEINPDQSGILNNLAWVLGTSPKEEVRDGKRAIELATRSCELTEYKKAHILSTLAAAYAEAGDFENAKKWSKKAVELGDEEHDDQLELELKSYEEGKPWREVQETEEKEADDVPDDDLLEEGAPGSLPGRTPDF